MKNFCSTPLACAAAARQALSAVAQALQATGRTTSTVRAQPCDGPRGGPGREAPPDHVVYQGEGVLASSITARQALIDQHRCCLLATNALETPHLPPPAVVPGDKGQGQAERGFRLLKDPQVVASSRSRHTPERLMALWMVRTGGVLVYAAVEDGIRQALNEHEATFPDQQGKRMHQPTARWVFHDVVGIHLLCQAGQWPSVLTLTEEHQPLLRLLGPPSMRLYDVRYSSTLGGRCAMSVLAALSPDRPLEERQGILERYYGTCESIVRESPRGHRKDNVHLYMTLAKPEASDGDDR